MKKLVILALAASIGCSLSAAKFGQSLDTAMEKTTKDEEQRQKKQKVIKTTDKLLDKQLKAYDPFKAKKAPPRPLPEYLQRGVDEAVNKKIAEYDKNLEKKIEAIVARKLKEAKAKK